MSYAWLHDQTAASLGDCMRFTAIRITKAAKGYGDGVELHHIPAEPQ